MQQVSLFGSRVVRRAAPAALALSLAVASPAPAQEDGADPGWAPAFVLELPAEASVSELFEMPCSASHRKGVPYCEAVWGTVRDKAGVVTLAAWTVAAAGRKGAPAQGARLRLSGDVPDLPVGGVWHRQGALIHTRDALFNADSAEGSGGGLHLDPVPLVTREGDEPYLGTLPRLEQFGIFDVAYSATLDVFAVGVFGELTFWRYASRTAPALESVCRIRADGAVPWYNIRFSRNGGMLAASHGGWTMVVDIAASGGLGPASGEQQDCPGVEVSSIHYYPLLDLSASGDLVAVADREYAPGDVEIADHVLGVYQSGWLVGAPNQGTTGRSASEVTGAGLVANFFGHDSPIVHAAFSPADTDVLSVTEDGVLRLWSLGDGALTAAHPEILGRPVASADFVGQTGCLAVTLRDGPSVLFDPGPGRVLHEFAPPSGSLVPFGEDALLFTYTPGDGPVRAYDTAGVSCDG